MIRAYALLIVVVGWLVDTGICRADERQPSALRIMSYNIRYNTLRDGLNAWPFRKQLVAKIIRSTKADAIGLQEAKVEQLNDLRKLLPEFHWCGVGRVDGKQAGEHAAILYRHGRLKLLENDTIWYSATPDRPSQGWDTNHRVMTWARLREKTSSDDFVLFNTHLGFTKEHRRKAGSLLLDQIHRVAEDGPVILTGDFNFRVGSPQYQEITAVQDPTVRTLQDAMDISAGGHKGPTSTFTDFQKLEPPGTRIDFIFVNGRIRVWQHRIIADRFNGRYASDHLPVLAELGIAEASQ